eukprot:3195309-Alexandrium_andersonii.AAC.1
MCIRDRGSSHRRRRRPGQCPPTRALPRGRQDLQEDRQDGLQQAPQPCPPAPPPPEGEQPE